MQVLRKNWVGTPRRCRRSVVLGKPQVQGRLIKARAEKVSQTKGFTEPTVLSRMRRIAALPHLVAEHTTAMTGYNRESF
jgi:hypothetical protein